MPGKEPDNLLEITYRRDLPAAQVIRNAPHLLQRPIPNECPRNKSALFVLFDHLEKGHDAIEPASCRFGNDKHTVTLGTEDVSFLFHRRFRLQVSLF